MSINRLLDGVNCDDFLMLASMVASKVMLAPLALVNLNVMRLSMITIRQHSIIYVAYRFAEGNDDVVTDCHPGCSGKRT